MARVKRILQLDEDINQCSNNAAFVITVATVCLTPLCDYLDGGRQSYVYRKCLFATLRNRRITLLNRKESLGGTYSTKILVRFFRPSNSVVIADKRYKANAVARIDNLEFLSDVIPRTQTYGQYMEKKNREYKETKSREAARTRAIENGQTTLEGSKPRQNGTHADIEIDNEEHTDELMVGGGNGSSLTSVAQSSQPPRANGTLVFEHYEPNVGGRRDASGDVEME